MNAISAAIFTQLQGGTALTALLYGGTATGSASIFEDHAPTSAELPYVIFNQQAATWDYSMGEHKRFASVVYQVKGVSGSAWPKEADAIDAQIDARLDNAALSITGYGLLRVVRESDVRFSETEGEQVFQHVGALYRIDVVKS